MAGAERFVCVDWGTTRLRAALCEFDGNESLVLDTLDGPGILAARHSVEVTLFELIAPWTREHGQVPVLLSGGVGSNIGWRTTPYLPCPFNVRDLSGHCTSFTTHGRDIVIVPGLECENSFGETDTMRSEELQILGWLQAEPSRSSGMHLVCLPGTHTKWALIEDGRIMTFQSAVTGELYAIMRDHSILLAQNGETVNTPASSTDAFSLGVAVCRKAKGNLSHALFSTRSRLLKGQFDADAAAAYLSGILIAADVMAAIALLKPSPEYVSLVGEPDLCKHFSSVLQSFSLGSETMEGGRAATEGFSVVYRDLYQPHRRSASA